MKIYFNKLAVIASFTYVCCISQSALAIDCKSSLNMVEKIVCNNDYSLKSEDEELNKSFKKLLTQTSKEDRKGLKKSMSDLLKARNECENLYGLLDGYPEQVVDVGNEDHEIFPLKNIHYQKACIKTWYESINFALNKSIDKEDAFILPTYHEYISLYKKLSQYLKLYPFDFSVSIPVRKGDNPEDEGENTRDQENRLQLFFGKNNERFGVIKESSYFYNFGTAHGQGYSSKNFLVLNNHEVVKINDLGSGSYKCSVPIKKPIAINGRIYLPENISFTEVFDRMFGELDSFQPYVCTGAYKPDCMLRLKSLGENGDSYLLFTTNYIVNFKNKNDENINYNPDCFYKILKKHAIIDASFNKFCVKERQCINVQDDQCLFVKESSIPKIKKSLLKRNSCKN